MPMSHGGRIVTGGRHYLLMNCVRGSGQVKGGPLSTITPVIDFLTKYLETQGLQTSRNFQNLEPSMNHNSKTVT